MSGGFGSNEGEWGELGSGMTNQPGVSDVIPLHQGDDLGASSYDGNKKNSGNSPEVQEDM